MNFRESYVFHCLVIKVLNLLSLRQLVYFITFISACQVLFSSFFRSFFDVCVSLSGDLFTLSHPHRIVNNFFAFFKTFQIVYSEETILRDSSVRITLSNRAVNNFFQKNLFIFVLLFFYCNAPCISINIATLQRNQPWLFCNILLHAFS